MPIFTVDECMTPDCEEPLTPEAGVFYCPKCIAEQEAEAAAMMQAFDDYHRWADALARGTS